MVTPQFYIAYLTCFSDTFDAILTEIIDELPVGASSNGKSLAPVERLLIFLFFLAGNSLYWIKKYSHSASYGTIVNAIHQCLDACYKKLVPKFITLPTNEQAKVEAALFHEMSGFPPIIWSAIGNYFDTHTILLTLFEQPATSIYLAWATTYQG